MMSRSSTQVLGLGFAAMSIVTALGTGCSSSDSSPPSARGGGSSVAGSANSGGSAGTGVVGAGGSGNAVGTGGSSVGIGGTSAAAGTTGSLGGSSTGGQGDTCAPAAEDCTTSMAPGSLPFADFASDPGFYLFANAADKTGMTMPASGMNVTPEEITCPVGGLCGGALTYAMHVSGGGFTTYGPTLGKANVYASTAMPGTFEGMPQDISMYSGVEFWARKGTSNSNPQIGITLDDDTSDPAAKLCDPNAMPGTTATPSKACYDGFYAKVSATSNWRLFKIAFSSMKQQGFGNPSADMMFHSKVLYGLTFNLPAQSFDLWIGNVSFY